MARSNGEARSGSKCLVTGTPTGVIIGVEPVLGPKGPHLTVCVLGVCTLCLADAPSRRLQLGMGADRHGDVEWPDHIETRVHSKNTKSSRKSVYYIMRETTTKYLEVQVEVHFPAVSPRKLPTGCSLRPLVRKAAPPLKQCRAEHLPTLQQCYEEDD